MTLLINKRNIKQLLCSKKKMRKNMLKILSFFKFLLNIKLQFKDKMISEENDKTHKRSKHKLEKQN